MLGADVTVIDISEENKKYATELAEAAGVSIHYIVSDVLQIPEDQRLAEFDFVILELGVLHYFIDLDPLFRFIYDALKPGGKFILRDYHPFASKVVNAGEAGNYFDKELKEVEVAYTILLSDAERANLSKTVIRRWTLGEIVTSVVRSGLHIHRIDEEQGVRWTFPHDAPEGIEDRIPGLYTIISSRD